MARSNRAAVRSSSSQARVRRGLRGTAATATAVFVVALAGTSPAEADSAAPVSGAGSTWAQNTIDLWRAGAARHDVRVAYSATGSADGRKQFRDGTADFAVTELPYGTDADDTPPTRPYAYVPVVAGGIGFTYNLRVDGKRITDLRLSSATVAGIFTRAITRWNDPAIRADNPGITLPDLAITPVVRSDDAATTAGLTQWLDHEQPAAWSAYCAAAGRGADCGTTALFPTVPGDVALAGSNGVTGYVALPANNGSITYAESSYTLATNLTTARLLNVSGYYTTPTVGAVAVGLSTATTGPSGIVDATAAYTNPDPRAYPLPLVGHLIVPTAADDRFTASQGQELGTFGFHGLCHQQDAARMGNAPLPPGLVRAGLDTVRRIPGSSLDRDQVSDCVAAAAVVLQNAPQPRACDRMGGPPCDDSAPGHRMATISTTLEPGALLLSVAGDPHVELPTPVLDASGEFLHTTGQLAPVTVTDTRPGDIGWTVTAQAGDFADLAGNTIDANHLTWTPTVLNHGNVRTVTAGDRIAPGDGTGLKDIRTLATGVGPGTADLGAGLALDAPTSTPPGTYTAVLTLTLI
ncbi:phosphate ABC transporter substrate-binding protein PstS [Streptomyces sp. NPDC088732]|uniref:phosphate ABC transporter substrate-binding protein PstS n=1 Tax=Streptomyces sp. NPDC088732 TaxID=3365879 RepID=UPI0038247DDD